MASPHTDSTEVLVQLDARCPRCGAGEARRVAKWRLELYRNLDPDLPAETIECHRCKQSYIVKTKAYQNAR